MVLVLKPKWNKNQIYTTRSNSLIYLQSLLNLCFTAFSSKLKKRKEAMDTYRHGNNACSMTTPLSAMAEAFEELLEISDVVTLHVDGRPSNSSLFGEKEFSQMRPGALFLNLCRGFVIDHHALRTHLLAGHRHPPAGTCPPERARRDGGDQLGAGRARREC